MLSLLAWRNVWRNPSRTRGLVFSLSLSLLGLWTLGALIKGLNEHRVKERVSTSLGHIKITSKQFLSHKPTKAFWVFDEVAKQKLQNLPTLLAYAPRLNVRGATERDSVWHTLDVYGVLPDEEKQVLDLPTKLIKGTYIPNVSSVVVGKALSEKLHITIGDSITLFLPVVLRVRVSGIYDVPNKDFAETHVFVHYKALQRLLSLPTGACHQLLLKTTNENETHLLKKRLQARFPTLWVRTWQDTAPDLAYLHTITTFFLGILAVIACLCLGALQYILLHSSWQERLLEWQRLRAWGLTKREVNQVWAMEIMLIFGLGIAIGSLFGLGLLLLLTKWGVSLAWFGEGLQKMGYAHVIFPLILWKDWAMLVLFFLFLPCLLVWRRQGKIL